MSKNHMAEVAALLGVELGEPFKITDDCQRYHRFTESAGIEISDDGIEWKTAGTVILKWLLMGDVRIVKLPWKPQEDEKYYVPNIATTPTYMYVEHYWLNEDIDMKRYRMGLVCKTKEEATAMTKKMLMVVTGE